MTVKEIRSDCKKTALQRPFHILPKCFFHSPKIKKSHKTFGRLTEKDYLCTEFGILCPDRRTNKSIFP